VYRSKPVIIANVLCLIFSIHLLACTLTRVAVESRELNQSLPNIASILGYYQNRRDESTSTLTAR
jgi:hypothetical protein